jgi:hypothetical protein
MKKIHALFVKKIKKFINIRRLGKMPRKNFINTCDNKYKVVNVVH